MKTNHKKYLFITIALVLIVSFHSPGQVNLRIINFEGRDYVSLYDFIKNFDLSNSYDIVTGRGKLYYKGAFAVYQVGLSAALVNNRIIKSDYPIIIKNGEVFLPARLFEEIAARFYPGSRLVKRDNYYHLEKMEAQISREDAEKPEQDRPIERHDHSDRIAFIIIDPGHGGKDPGAVAPGGLREKVITLRISKYLESYLKRKLRGIRIHMTRRDDRFIELAKRTEIANKLLKSSTNGLFISIHVNASIVKSVSGFETYFLSQNPSNEEARTTAALENNVVILEEKSSRDSYGDIDHIQALMLTTQIQRESSMLAKCIQEELDKKIWESKSKGVKKADFFVLRGALLPAVLIEVGFISNKKESKNLVKAGYQKKIAEGVGNGVIDFITKYNREIKK